jgi:hypothetical protein
MWPVRQAFPLQAVPERIDIGLVELPKLLVAEPQLAADDAGWTQARVDWYSSRTSL